MAVVAILAIVSAIALPQFGPRDDVKLAAAAREIAADLMYAQSLAIATGKTHFIAFDADEYRVLDCIDPARVIRNPTTGAPFCVKFTAGPLLGVTPAEINFDGAGTLAFDSAGMPHACPAGASILPPLLHGSIILTSGQSTLTLTIEPFSGIINIH